MKLVYCVLILALAAGCVAASTSATDRETPFQHSEYLPVEGAKLYVLTRGADQAAPVLLWLHGGPGGPERPLFRYFNGDLEDYFIVSYWDQRGAGRSFDPKGDMQQLTIARHLADLDTVIAHLKQLSDQDRVVLIGHSWGATLGLLYASRHPENVAAFIGVAPLISLRKAQQAQYDFVLAEAMSRKDEAVLARLNTIGPPPNITADQQMAMEDLADQYGAVFHERPCRMCIVAQGLLSGLVTPWELLSIHRGNRATLEAMTPELLDLDLNRAVPHVSVPVFFYLGRHDRHVDSSIAAGYFESLRAPKRLIWFENSAHNVPFEEPQLFNETVVRSLQSIGIERQIP
jgi:pimeloyl-ACP methyl ester carboxylesterase